MKRPRITLRTKVTVAVAFAVIASAAAISAVAYVTAYKTEHRLFADTSLQQSDQDATTAKSLMTTRSKSAAIDAIRKYFDGRRFGDVFDPSAPGQCHGYEDGGDPCFSDLPVDVRDAVEAPYAFSSFYGSPSLGGPSYIVVSPLIVPKHPPLALVDINGFSAPHTALHTLRTRLLEVNAAGLLLALIVGFAVATGLRRPIRRVGTAAQRFGDGGLDVRTKVRGKDELADLATSFNTMADRLSTTLRDLQASQSLQQRFVSDVSHELRTPLATMLAAGDGLDSPDRNARERSADLLRSQTRRMAGMVEDLLEMSRFDAGQAVLQLESVDLLDLVREAVQTIAPDGDIRVSGLGEPQAEVDVGRMLSIVRNLVANAVQHGTPPVWIGVDGQAPEVVVLTVTDAGHGIPADVRDTLFDRFVRADTSRTTAGESTGLGLAIAAENASLHGATLTLADAAATTFVLRIPRTTDRPKR